MIVCIGIIAALGVVIGLNADTILKRSNIKNYQGIWQEIFDAASIYSELSDNADDCEKGCTITLDNLVQNGLLDSSIYNKNNPVYKEKVLFTKIDFITVSINNGLKEVTYRCNNSKPNYDLKKSTLDEYKYWGEC